MPENPITQSTIDDRQPLAIGRDQILNRLWELATLNPEVTRGSMAGQIKAIAMIVAIEGLIPSRLPQARGAQPAAAVTAVKPQPTAPHVSEPEPPSHPANEAAGHVSLKPPTSQPTNTFPRGRQTP